MLQKIQLENFCQHENLQWTSLQNINLTVDLFISILSFGMAAFAIGYALGQSSNKTQK